MNDFWKSDTFKIIKAMKASGNQPGIITQWRDRVAAWAQNVEGPHAEAIRAWLPMWQVRQYYTAAELAPIWPLLPIAMGWSMKPDPRMAQTPRRLAQELIFGGLPRIFIDGQEYFVVEQLHKYRGHSDAA